ncbi:MAG TPA: DUF2339 domain-containing protein [Vicinamibacterales bacterium]|nr:DUF2339 domain-containing protein [Vicinamibacterales bacterium]
MLAAVLAFVALCVVVFTRARLSHVEQELAQLRDIVSRLVPPPVVTRAPAESSAQPDSPRLQPSEQDVNPVAPPRKLFKPTVSALPYEREEVERAIGERWLLYAGVIVLLLAVSFFLRYAFDRDWLSPLVRVVMGGAAGLVMIVGGRRLATSGYRSYGVIVAGSGVASLYLSAYAALNFYELIPAPAAFVLLVAISAAAAWMAHEEDAPALAVVAVLGGFATPFLVGGGEDAQLTLFTYLAVLITATAALSLRHEWWYLDVLALALTMVDVAAWFSAYYTPAKAVRTDLFLALYCTLFLIILRAREAVPTHNRRARTGARILLLAPVAYHLTSIAILSADREAFLTYVIVASTVAVIVAERVRMPALRAIAWAAMALPLAIWLQQHSRGTVTGSLIGIAAVYVVHLAAQLQALRHDDRLSAVDVALVHANGLGLYAGLAILLEPNHSNVLASVAAALAAWNGVLTAAVARRFRLAALHFGAVTATLTAIAIATEFDGPWVVVMWGMEAAAIVAIAVRTDRPWFRMAGWGLMLLAVLRWIAPDVQDTATAAKVVFNARALSALLLVVLLYLLARWLKEGATIRSVRLERAGALVAANALSVVLISREIAWYWTLRELRGDAVSLARQSMLSGAWAIYAAAASAVGIRRCLPAIRYFAIALFGLTLVKVFLVDLQTLGGLSRIAAFFVVGVVLLFASFLYQRRRNLSSR